MNITSRNISWAFFLTNVFLLAQGQITKRETASQLFAKGTLALEQSQWNEASLWFRKAIDADVRFLPAHEGYQLVEFFYFERSKQVITEYRKLLSQNPNEAMFHYLLGFVSVEEQEALMDRALALDSTFAPAYAFLGRKYFFESNLDSAGLFIDLGIRYCKNDAEIWGLRHSYEIRLNSKDELRQTVDMMSKLVPKSTGMAFAYLKMARNESKKENKVQLLEKAILADTLGLIANQVVPLLVDLYAEDDSSKAEGFAWTMTAYRSRVSLDYRKGMDKRVPVEGYLALWKLYIQRDTAKAILLAKEVLKANSDNFWLYYWFARNNVLQQREPLLCVELLRRSLALCTAGRMWGTSAFGRPSRTHFDKLAENLKSSVLSELGWAYYLVGNQSEALKSLRSASGRSDRNEATVHWRIGQVYEKFKKPRQAFDAYVRSLSFEEDPKVRARVSELSATIFGFSVALPEKRNASIDAAIANAQIQRRLRSKDFSVRLLDGSTVSSKSVRGKLIILNFWATWCGPCIAELPHLQELYNQIKNTDDVVIVALSTETSEKIVQEFVQKQNYTFPVGLDRGLAFKYDVTGIPTMLLIDKQGYIRYKHIGYDDSVDFLGMMNKEIQIVRKPIRH